MATSSIADSVGRVLGGRYRLTRLIGTGSSAHVYLADDVTLRRRVAVKMLHPGLADDAAFLRRFSAEARAVANLRHPNILRVYDWGDEAGRPYLVSELLEGGSLRSLLDTGYLMTPAQATLVGYQAASALDYAHRRSLVHRDIKPANLLFDDEGRVSVADFGLARALAEAAWTEPVGSIVGTARYAAPEQLEGRPLDDRADVYSLALVLIEAVTGTVPFATDTLVGTLMGRLARPIGVPAPTGPLRDVLAAAGTVDPADRLDAPGLLRELGEVARHLAPPAAWPLVGPLHTGAPERDLDPTVAPAGTTRPPAPAGPSVLLGATAAGAVSTPAAPSGGTGPGAGGTGPGGDPTVTQTAPEVPAPDGPAAPEGSAAADGPAAQAAGPVPPTVGPVAPTVGPVVPTVGPYDGLADAASDDRPGPVVAGPPATGRPRRRRGLVAVVLVVVVALVAGGGAAAWELTRPAPEETVPGLAGDTVGAAGAALASRHLSLRVAGHAYDASVPQGRVVAQTPTSGRLREHGTVGVTISLGPRPVPVPAALAGRTEAAAEVAVRAAGLRVGTVTTRTSVTVPAGSVIAVTPDTGTLLPGGRVALVVSSGKPSVTVPLLRGPQVLSFAAASAALAARHLVATERTAYSTVVPRGEVIVTAPAPGVSVVYGSAVSVEVSRGPHLVPVADVVGLSVAAADQTLTADGFVVTGVTGNPAAAVSGTVPAQGDEVLFGSDVQITTG